MSSKAPPGLTYVYDDAPGISRRRSGKGFTYRAASGRAVRDKKTLARIAKLAIPPAWEDVWISTKENGHLQATGRDARGRKQSRYHPRYREHQDSAKFDHLAEFGKGLPAIRKTINAHMRKQGLPRGKVLAAIVRLLDTTLIRVGNDEYARNNKSYGLTTLTNRHADVRGEKLRFVFTGKSGKNWRLTLQDRRVAKIVKAAQDLPGQRLFQYEDEDGKSRGRPYGISDLSDDEQSDGQVALKTIADLRRMKESGQPFFIAAGFFKPHLPFICPKKYWDLYPEGSLKLPTNYHSPKDAPEVSIHNFGELRAYNGVPKTGPLPDAMALEKKGGVLWIDARRREQFDKDHIPGAMLLNIYEWDDLMLPVINALSDGPRRPVIIYCDAQKCSASRELREKIINFGLGEFEIRLLHGGWPAWQAATRAK